MNFWKAICDEQENESKCTASDYCDDLGRRLGMKAGKQKSTVRRSVLRSGFLRIMHLAADRMCIYDSRKGRLHNYALCSNSTDIQRVPRETGKAYNVALCSIGSYRTLFAVDAERLRKHIKR